MCLEYGNEFDMLSGRRMWTGWATEVEGHVTIEERN